MQLKTLRNARELCRSYSLFGLVVSNGPALLSIVCVGLKQTRIHSLLLNALFIFAAHQYCIFVHNERACFIDDVKSHISFPVANMTACWYCDLMS